MKASKEGSRVLPFLIDIKTEQVLFGLDIGKPREQM